MLLSRLWVVFQVGNFFHPVDGLAVELLGDCDVGHGGGGGGPVPMFFAGRKPDDVSGMNGFNGSAFALGASTACGHDQHLSQWMGVPSGAGSRLKGDNGSADTG